MVPFQSLHFIKDRLPFCFLFLCNGYEKSNSLGKLALDNYVVNIYFGKYLAKCFSEEARLILFENLTLHMGIRFRKYIN